MMKNTFSSYALFDVGRFIADCDNEPGELQEAAAELFADWKILPDPKIVSAAHFLHRLLSSKIPRRARTILLESLGITEHDTRLFAGNGLLERTGGFQVVQVDVDHEPIGKLYTRKLPHEVSIGVVWYDSHRDYLMVNILDASRIKSEKRVPEGLMRDVDDH